MMPRDKSPFIFVLALLAAMWAALVSPFAQAGRVALVIGNGAYADIPLRNPANDARAMSAKLRELGFSVVYRENLTTRQIGGALREFRSRISPGDEAVVFYAGHGLQVKGSNYLPAVDAEISSEEDVPQQSISLTHLLDTLEESKAGVKIVFLDACRNNPYARQFRSAERGLSRVGAAPSGTLISFATKPGSVAADGTGQNGLYTEQLLRHIGAEGVPVELMLKEVAIQVEQVSAGKQEPWSEGNIKGNFYFKPGGSPGTQVASLRPEPARPAPMPPPSSAPRSEDPETQFWSEVKASGAKEYYEAYVKQYPKGKYVALAKVELKKLEDQEKTQKAREAAEVQRLQREAAERERAEAARLQAEAARQKADEARQRAEAERLARVAPKVRVKDAWVRNTKPARKSTCAFMEITSSDEAALLSAASPAAGVVEIHTLKMEDGVMKMRRIPKLDLPAGKGVTLQPGGYCIWLTELKQQMNMGDVVPITLKIEGKDKKVQTVEIKADVR